MEAKMALAKANRTLLFFRAATPPGRPPEAAVFVASLGCSAIVTFYGSLDQEAAATASYSGAQVCFTCP
jgi:hypothetical protein